jgi:hypothetical protein
MRFIPMVKSAELLAKIIRCNWLDIIVLNVHVLTKDTSDGAKDSFYEDTEYVFNQL